jgi:hypothetical protein
LPEGICAKAQGGLDGKAAADHFQALPHAKQPEVLASLPVQHTIHLKGFAVVLYFHAKPSEGF